MAQQLILFLIYIVIFLIVAYGLYWICVKFELGRGDLTGGSFSR